MSAAPHCRARLAHFLVPLAVALVVVPAAAATHDGTPTKPGKLTFAAKIGAALPYHRGIGIVHVVCQGTGKSRCRGSVRLLPRGERTRGLVGAAPLATRAVNLKGHHRAAIRLQLSTRARREAASAVLSVTVEVRSARGRWITRRVALGAARPIVGDPKPDHVQVEHPPQGGGPPATVKTFDWERNIPAHHYYNLPAFHCPEDAPVLATNGTELNSLGFWDGMQADMTVSADSGVGYGAAFTIETDFRSTEDWVVEKVGVFQHEYHFPDYRVMTGWPEGSWSHNSVWAPLLSDGNFHLWVTCTSLTGKRQIAWALRSHDGQNNEYFEQSWRMVPFAF
jgi:hypothetical protein